MKKFSTAIVFASALFAGGSNAANLVSNSSFESGLSGWTCTGADLCTSDTFRGSTSGTRAAIGYDNGGFATLSQTLVTTTGQTYDFSFFSRASQSAGNTLAYSFSGVANQVVVPTTSSFTQTMGTFVASSNSTSIQFYFATDPGTGTWAIDDVSVQVSAVPEPETYALMLAGLGLIGTISRRRKQTLAA